MNASTTKPKCVGMQGNKIQRVELRVENKIMGKI